MPQRPGAVLIVNATAIRDRSEAGPGIDRAIVLAFEGALDVTDEVLARLDRA